MSENLSPNTPESSSSDDDESDSKSKSKKKAIGAFLVEPKPKPKAENIWGFSLGGDAKTGSFGTKTDEKKDGAFSFLKTSETKADTQEDLQPQELTTAIQQLAAARAAEIVPETETESQTTAEDMAALAYLAAVEQDGDVDAAYEQVAAELGLEAEEMADLEVAAEVEPTVETPESNVDETVVGANENSEGEIPLHEPSVNAEAPAGEEVPAGEEAPETILTIPTTPVRPVNRSGSGRRPMGGSSFPSFSPVPSFGGSAGHNSLPASTLAGNTITAAAAAANERRALGNGLVVGAVVGYLYGRRRGRIKTEKRLAPVRQKLEKQVAVLQSELLAKEQTVRRQARSVSPEILTAAAKNRPVAVTTERPIPTVRPLEVLAVPLVVASEAAIRSIEKASSNVFAAVKPEHIGHVLVAASELAFVGKVGEAKPATAPKVEVIPALTAKKQAETMSRAELLSFSEKIMVDGTSLRQVYETQLVSERGLRRLVAEHLRGKNMSKALKRELIERDIDFERDPMLRDRSHDNGGSNGGDKSVLAAMLAKAGAPQEAEQQPIGSKKQIKGKDELSKGTEAAKDKSQAKQTAADVGLVTLITVLVFVIVAILMRGQ